jgi:Tfp pilus assembly PilM family ATPase
MTINPFFEKVLKALHVRSIVGGLEISDLALRFAYFNGTEWELAGLRLPPGVMDGGQIKDREQFIKALRALHKMIRKKEDRHIITVVAALSSVNIYSQEFNLPLLSGEDFKKAVDLNLQMIAPSDIKELYSGWQFLTPKNTGSMNCEILAAFINRKIMDELKSALLEGGFLCVAAESKSMGLARIVRTWAVEFDTSKAYIVLFFDNSGLEFLIMRNGQLYFEYFTSWKDFQLDERQLSTPTFAATVIRDLNQIITFYRQQWQNPPLDNIFILSPGFDEQIKAIVESNFSLKVVPFTLKTAQSISLSWLVTLGSGLRGIIPRQEDRDISLLGTSASQEFNRQQLSNFLDFWRVMVPAGLGVLFAAFLGVNMFLSSVDRSLKSLVSIRSNPAQLKEVEEIQNRAKVFNETLALINSIEQSTKLRNRVLDQIDTYAKENTITLHHVNINGDTGLISGEAVTEEKILNFKRKLDSEGKFKSVELPLADLKAGSQGVSFLMNLSIISPTLAKTF